MEARRDEALMKAYVTGVNPETAKSRLRYAVGKLKKDFMETDTD